LLILDHAEWQNGLNTGPEYHKLEIELAFKLRNYFPHAVKAFKYAQTTVKVATEDGRPSDR
jgi:hypothetical protein